MGQVTVDVHLTPQDLRASLESDVRSGLTSVPKSLPPVWFYDERGSHLFEDITELPEYYPTRAERQLLEQSAPEVARISKAHTLVELGAGACEKTRVLLDALHRSGNLHRYVAFDVSLTTADAAERVGQDYGDLRVQAVIGDFHQHLDRLSCDGRCLVAFLGGTIGNLRPDQRRKFLFDLSASMEPSGYLLLGTDLVKDQRRLVAAYDDAAGVTAQFNRNVLEVLNRELGADFDPTRFAHVARWNDQEEWIEMRLRATEALAVEISALGLRVRFDKGEDLLTEISAKFTPKRVEDELAEAGFVVDQMWGATQGEFLLTLAHPVP